MFRRVLWLSILIGSALEATDIKNTAKIVGYATVGGSALVTAAVTARMATNFLINGGFRCTPGDIFLGTILGTNLLGSCVLLHKCATKGYQAQQDLKWQGLKDTLLATLNTTEKISTQNIETSNAKSAAKIAGYTVLGASALSTAVTTAMLAILSSQDQDLHDLLSLCFKRASVPLILGYSLLGSCVLLHECASRGLKSYKNMKDSIGKKAVGLGASAAVLAVCYKTGKVLL